MIQDLEDQTMPTPAKDMALIVFVGPWDAADVAGTFALPFSITRTSSRIYNITSGAPKFISMINRGKKTTYEVLPGEYMFKSQNLLALEVTAGKTYYILADHYALGGTTGVKLKPVRNGGVGEWQYSSESFQKGLETTELAITHPKAREYFSKKWLKTETKVMKQLLKKWVSKSENERQEFTLNPEDGIPAGYHSIQDTNITQGAKTESSQVNPFLDKQEELRTSVVENPESANSGSSAYIGELKVLEALRDDGIFTEEEFQKQKSKLLENE